jgi:hypothetical protein
MLFNSPTALTTQGLEEVAFVEMLAKMAKLAIHIDPDFAADVTP